ncbi:hypothetical protein EW146_g6901 [Bondarzewia mesenterica]|uniref:Uncharacterized protein n=1 Tax=Bondarzewia mesenterica TaxID=1095465 RepID=A0A4S4LMY4_9AGAM|nr:hypothetical protein EW146_g6901 [Bondarzewia mesenterica]
MPSSLSSSSVSSPPTAPLSNRTWSSRLIHPPLRHDVPMYTSAALQQMVEMQNTPVQHRDKELSTSDVSCESEGERAVVLASPSRPPTSDPMGELVVWGEFNFGIQSPSHTAIPGKRATQDSLTSVIEEGTQRGDTPQLERVRDEIPVMSMAQDEANGRQLLPHSGDGANHPNARCELLNTMFRLINESKQGRASQPRESSNTRRTRQRDDQAITIPSRMVWDKVYVALQDLILLNVEFSRADREATHRSALPHGGTVQWGDAASPPLIARERAPEMAIRASATLLFIGMAISRSEGREGMFTEVLSLPSIVPAVGYLLEGLITLGAPSGCAL